MRIAHIASLIALAYVAAYVSGTYALATFIMASYVAFRMILDENN
jgi:hypothetical protein